MSHLGTGQGAGTTGGQGGGAGGAGGQGGTGGSGGGQGPNPPAATGQNAAVGYHNLPVRNDRGTPKWEEGAPAVVAIMHYIPIVAYDCFTLYPD